MLKNMISKNHIKTFKKSQRNPKMSYQILSKSSINPKYSNQILKKNYINM